MNKNATKQRIFLFSLIVPFQLEKNCNIKKKFSLKLWKYLLTHVHVGVITDVEEELYLQISGMKLY